MYKTELAMEFCDCDFNYALLMEIKFFLLTFFKVNPLVVYIEYKGIHSTV